MSAAGVAADRATPDWLLPHLQERTGRGEDAACQFDRDPDASDDEGCSAACLPRYHRCQPRMAQHLIDVSLPLRMGRIAVYPGNPPLRITTHRGLTSVYSKITIGSHTGTHLDAPRHVFPRGQGIDAMPLEALIGPCRVLACTNASNAVTVADLEPHRIRRGERILVKTSNSRRGYEKFYTQYVYLDGDAAEWLGRKRIALFGVDYLSVKQRGATDNRPHTALLGRGIPIIEGLYLKNVKPGKYQLIALPLKFTGLDGAPARVVLMR